MEGVDVPLVRRVACGDDLVAQLVGRADLRAARLAGVVEGVLVHLLGDRVVDDVDGLEALVVGLEPGVDPERLDAHDLLLLVGHRAGHVHHVDDDGDGSGAAAPLSTTRYCLSSRMGMTIGSSGS